MTTVALPFEFVTRGRQVANADADLARVLWEDRDRQLEDWIAKVWTGGDGLQDGAIGRDKLAVDAIQSTNYDGPDLGEIFSDAGSFFDLATGDLITPGLVVDAAAGTVAARGEFIATGFELVNSLGVTIATWDDADSGLWGSDGYLEFIHDDSGATMVSVPSARTRFGINEAAGNFAGGQLEQVTANEDADGEQGRAGLKWNGDMSGVFGTYVEIAASWERYMPTGDGLVRTAAVRATAGRTGAEQKVEIDANYVEMNGSRLAEPVHIRLGRSSTAAIANAGAGTAISFAVGESFISHDTILGSFKDAAAAVVTVPVAGLYLVGWGGQFDTNGTGVRQVWVNVGSNATAAATGELSSLFSSQAAHASIPSRISSTALVRLDAGATLELFAYQNSGGSLNISNTRLDALLVARGGI